MALRVLRGLFRLWLVLSVLWIGGVAVITWRKPIYNDVVVCEEVEAPPSGSCLPRSWIPKLQPFVDETRRDAVRSALVLALVPPALALALGSALIWAVRGFRWNSVRQRLPVKIYLDNNIVSAIAKDDEPAESHALDRLLRAWRKGNVDLVTSELTLAEIKLYQDMRMRAAIERIFRLLEKVDIIRWDELVGMHSYGNARTWITTPLIENYPEYGALLALGLEVTDAQHVYVAGKQVCDNFLTCDKPILQRAAGVKNIFPSLTVQKPSQLVASQRW
jgi:predicted nucleic acid-binding protein